MPVTSYNFTWIYICLFRYKSWLLKGVTGTQQLLVATDPNEKLFIRKHFKISSLYQAPRCRVQTPLCLLRPLYKCYEEGSLPKTSKYCILRPQCYWCYLNFFKGTHVGGSCHDDYVSQSSQSQQVHDKSYDSMLQTPSNFISTMLLEIVLQENGPVCIWLHAYP